MKNKVVTFGEIMLRLATPGYLRFAQTTEFEATFGGGEANVAVSLATTEFLQALYPVCPKTILEIMQFQRYAPLM